MTKRGIKYVIYESNTEMYMNCTASNAFWFPLTDTGFLFNDDQLDFILRCISLWGSLNVATDELDVVGLTSIFSELDSKMMVRIAKLLLDTNKNMRCMSVWSVVHRGDEDGEMDFVYDSLPIELPI